jgi:hypothetical protein
MDAKTSPLAPPLPLTVTYNPTVVESKQRFGGSEPSRSCFQDTYPLVVRGLERVGQGFDSAPESVNSSLTAPAISDSIAIIGPQTLVERVCMGVSYPHGQIASLAAGAVLLLSLSLGGCANSNASLMDARAEAPTPAQSYLPVEDLPPKRKLPALTVDEQSKLKKQLIDARDRQAAAVRARDNNGGTR